MNWLKIWVFFLFNLSIAISCEKEGSGTHGDDGSETVDTVAHETEDDYVYDSTAIVNITLNETTVTIDGTGAIAEGSRITIAHAGTFRITGSLDNGQIIVNTEDEQSVKIILDGVTIACLNNSPLYIKKSEKTIILLADNSENALSDGSGYVFDNTTDQEPSAVIFSKSDLTMFGNGTLNINGNFQDGISSKDGLIIKSGTYTVTAPDDGIRGKDYLIIRDGIISVKATNNGLKSDNDDTAALGYVLIEAGTLNIAAGGDGITAKTNAQLLGGDITVTTGGGSGHSVASASSAKGIKGLLSVTIACNSLVVNSADDALHSNGSVSIEDGEISLSSADDGIHGDKSINITNADVSILKSYEGIESADITVDNATLSVIASDDGFNATQGAATENNDNSSLEIKSGYVLVSTSGGDGLDSNGNIEIEGGTVIVHGPPSDPEVGMDCNGGCNVNGGILVISGINSNMTEAPAATSKQNAVLIRFSSTLAAGKIVSIRDGDGNSLITFAPVRNYASIVFSSADLKTDSTYSIYTGGSSTDSPVDGIYKSYSPGTLYATFTVSSVITTVGTSSGGGGGGGGGGPMPH